MTVQLVRLLKSNFPCALFSGNFWIGRLQIDLMVTNRCSSFLQRLVVMKNIGECQGEHSMSEISIKNMAAFFVALLKWTFSLFSGYQLYKAPPDNSL